MSESENKQALNAESPNPAQKKTIWTPTTIFTTLLFLTTGTMNTIALKLQDTRNYKHSALQGMNILLGQYLCL